MRTSALFRGAAVGAALLLAGPGTATPPAPGAARTVRVAAASDLGSVAAELTAAFERELPGARLLVTLGSSGAFFAQVKNGAPFDVFLSADEEYPRRLVEEGRGADGGLFRYATARLAVVLSATAPADAAPSLSSLSDPRLRRIAIANPRHAPYGRAAEEALRAAGVLEALRPRLVFGENVAQAAQFVDAGAADAAIVALPLVAARGTSLRWAEVPRSGFPRLVQAGLLLKGAGDRRAAAAFRDFLLGPEGVALLRRAGFGAPPR